MMSSSVNFLGSRCLKIFRETLDQTCAFPIGLHIASSSSSLSSKSFFFFQPPAPPFFFFFFSSSSSSSSPRVPPSSSRSSSSSSSKIFRPISSACILLFSFSCAFIRTSISSSINSWGSSHVENSWWKFLWQNHCSCSPSLVATKFGTRRQTWHASHWTHASVVSGFCASKSLSV